MRCVLLVFGLLLGLVAVRADESGREATLEERALLKEALKNSAQDQDRWAYTETRTLKLRKGGKAPKETIIRFDPSKPYAEQFTPVLIDGKKPSNKQLKEYRERGEKRGAALARAAEAKSAVIEEAQPAEAALDEPPPSDKSAAPAKERKAREVRADIENPRVVQDEGGRVVFEVPLVSTTRDVPAAKVELRAYVNKESRHLEKATMRVRGAFRVKTIAKVKGGEGTIEFTVVDPAYGPVITSASGSFGGSLMLLPVNPSFTYTRTEVKRVTPYDERFTVQVGALEALDF